VMFALATTFFVVGRKGITTFSVVFVASIVSLLQISPVLLRYYPDLNWAVADVIVCLPVLLIALFVVKIRRKYKHDA